MPAPVIEKPGELKGRYMVSFKPINAEKISENKVKSIYPEPFASMMNGRVKRKIGDHFGLKNFGVNLTELLPDSISALKHKHLKQEEFIYILSGTPTLVFGNNQFQMHPGECFGFKAGSEEAHQLVNNSNEKVVYLEIGDRTSGDAVVYPEDDLLAHSTIDGSWLFTNKNGEPY